MTLPEMFERACKARPELATIGLASEDGFVLDYKADRWRLVSLYEATSIPDALAETLIVGAAVKLLPGWSWCKIADGRHHAVEMIGMQREVVADTLPLALLSAVIATVPGEGEKR